MTQELKDRFQQVTTVNMILAAAEAEIKAQTGLEIRLVTLLPMREESGIHPSQMLAVLANSQGMLASDYGNASRRKPYVFLRHLGALFLRQYFAGLTLKEIGAMLGGYDHTSVLYAEAAAKQLIETGDEEFVKRYQNALEAITVWMRH